MYKFLSSVFLSLLFSAQLTLAFDSKIQGIVRPNGKVGFVYDETINDEEIEKFIFSLKDAILKDDRKKVATLANCTKQRPCIWNKVNFTGQVLIASSKIFLKNYDKIITNRVKDILKDINSIYDICPGIWGFVVKTEKPFIFIFDPSIGIIVFNSNTKFSRY